MSRCFPYPPPGYEARPRSEHKDLLKKEKHNEKKHKKEKEDRGKGERIEKDRDHRKDKHKKHKREKRRERRKNKDKDNSRIQTLEQESGKNHDLGNRRAEERGQNEAVRYIKPSDELVTQFLCQEGHTNHKGTGEIFPLSTESIGALGSKQKERNNLSGMVKKSAQATQHNHGNGVAQNSDSISYANKKETGRGVGSRNRIQNGKGLYVGSAETHSTRREGTGIGSNDRITPTSNAVQRAEQAGLYPDISSRSEFERSERISTKEMVQKVNQSVNNIHGKMDQQLVKSKDGAVRRKGKTNYHRGVRGEDRDQHVKKGTSKHKNKEKEREKNGNVNDHKHEDLDTQCANKSKVDDLMHFPSLCEKNLASDNIKKRKDLNANTSLCEPNLRMTKRPRISPARLTGVNGEISHHAQGMQPYSSTELVGANTSEVNRHGCQNSKECYNTGFHYLEEPSSPSYDSNKGCLKPPHPDTKYLSQVHSIPSVDVFSECIDQTWLFSGDRVEQKNGMFDAAESPQVWAEPQLIDSADVVALPYIVPL